jgi:iron complex transport system substrate-binding protein
VRADHRRARLVRAAASAAVFVCLLACGREQPVAPARTIRIVTLSPNLTEIVFAIGSGSLVAGTDDFSNYPAAARALPKVGGMQPDIEKIVALKPDLVLASTEGNHPSLEPALRAVRVPLLVVKTDRLADVAAAMHLLGGRLGAGPRADHTASALEAALAAQQRSRAHSPRVLFAVWTDPLYVAGQETFTNDLFVLAGAQNAVEVKGWPQYSLESLVAHPPDLLLYPKGSVTPQQVEALLAKASGVRPRVVAVDDDIFQRPGPRVVDAAKMLNAILDRAE